MPLKRSNTDSNEVSTRLICKNEKSNKFYSISLIDKKIIKIWGTIGSKGQSTERIYKTAKEAEAEYTKVIKSKKSSGYWEEGMLPETPPLPKKAKTTQSVSVTKSKKALPNNVTNSIDKKEQESKNDAQNDVEDDKSISSTDAVCPDKRVPPKCNEIPIQSHTVKIDENDPEKLQILKQIKDQEKIVNETQQVFETTTKSMFNERQEKIAFIKKVKEDVSNMENQEKELKRVVIDLNAFKKENSAILEKIVQMAKERELLQQKYENMKEVCRVKSTKAAVMLTELKEIDKIKQKKQDLLKEERDKLENLKQRLEIYEGKI
jgi:predicted DNA-binding WGR domain protein